jgi:hypothetical protein
MVRKRPGMTVYTDEQERQDEQSTHLLNSLPMCFWC